MRQTQQVKTLRIQAGMEDEVAFPLQFASANGEDGYQIPSNIGMERDQENGNMLVLTWLDVVRQDGKINGRGGPPPAGCLLEFLSLGIDGRYEALQRPLGSKATTADNEIAREEVEAAQEEVKAAQEVLKFVQTRGPLGIWPYQVSLTVREGAYRLAEPVHYYWGLARKMRTLLILAQHLRDPDRPHDTRPAKADLKYLLKRVPTSGDAELGDAAQMEELAGIVTYWMRCARIHPTLVVDFQNARWQQGLLLPGWWMGFEWDDSQEAARRLGREHLQPDQRYKSLDLLPREEQRPSCVFAMLAMQMAALLASPRGILQCSGCQRLFEPARKPRMDRDYIRTCGRPDCKKLAHNVIQNASNRRKRDKAKQTSDPDGSTL